MSYGYNLAGQVTSLSEPAQFGATVSYAHDSAGKLTNVTGAGFAGGVSQFASNLKYRASGALKEMDYGNGLRLNNGFNSRLQITNYQVKVPGTPVGEGESARSDYEYFADGRIKLSNDLTNPGFNRTFGYDQVGRLTGAAASNFAFSLSMGFDAFGNLVGRDSRSWRAFHYLTSQYQNNRNLETTTWAPGTMPVTTNWTHDAAGGVSHDHNKEYTRDAAGNTTRVFETTQIDLTLQKKLWIHQSYDGDGMSVKRVEQEQYNLGAFTFKTSYYLRSSVLGGSVVIELNQNGQKQEANVYANGTALAQQRDNQVFWTHIDPVTGSLRETNSTGVLVWHFEFDPLGNDAPLTDPAPPDEPSPDYLYTANYGSSGNPYDGASGCTVDGQPMDCSFAARLQSMGLGAACPDNRCSKPTARGVGYFRAFADGYQGYLPTGARYIGNGLALSRAAMGEAQDELAGLISLSESPDPIPQETSLQRWYRIHQSCVDDFLRGLSSNRIPSSTATSEIMTAASQEKVDETLIAVTWTSESAFSLGPESNGNAKDKKGVIHQDWIKEGNADIGPMQINYKTWHSWSGLDGLSNVFGTTTTGYKPFDGDVSANVRAGARILKDLNSRHDRAGAAGRYRTGEGDYYNSAKGQAAFTARKNRFNTLYRKYDKFFLCIKDRR